MGLGGLGPPEPHQAYDMKRVGVWRHGRRGRGASSLPSCLQPSGSPPRPPPKPSPGSKPQEQEASVIKQPWWALPLPVLTWGSGYAQHGPKMLRACHLPAGPDVGHPGGLGTRAHKQNTSAHLEAGVPTATHSLGNTTAEVQSKGLTRGPRVTGNCPRWAQSPGASAVLALVSLLQLGAGLRLLWPRKGRDWPKVTEPARRPQLDALWNCGKASVSWT